MIKNAWSGLKVNSIFILHGHSWTHQRIIYTHFLWPNCKKRRSLLSLLNNCLFDLQSWRNKNLLTVNWLKLTAILPQRYITCKTFFSPHHRLCQMSKNVSVIQVTEQWSRFDPPENFLLILFCYNRRKMIHFCKARPQEGRGNCWACTTWALAKEPELQSHHPNFCPLIFHSIINRHNVQGDFCVNVAWKLLVWARLLT